MDQSLSLQPSGDLHLSGYGDKQHGTLLFGQNRPFVPHSATSDITSPLPMSSCPQTESSISQGTQMPHEKMPVSDVSLENRSCGHQKKQTNPSQSKIQKPEKRQRYKPKPALVKKHGEPRDAETPLSGVPEDRRRMQVRLAQRAFRSRQRDAITGLNNRISQLETILDQMSLTVLSFSGQLVQSGVLVPYSDLTTHLHDTIKTFHDLASKANPDREEQVSNVPVPSHCEDLPQSSFPEPITTPPSNIPPSSSLDRGGSDHSTTDSSPHILESPGISVIELPEFIERLNLASLYQGKLALCDQSISLYRLQKPFGFLFSMMNRECLTAYFKARLDAQVSQKPLDGWAEVPFFGLGGAGTHYPRLSLQSQGVSHAFCGYHDWDIVKDPLSLVSPDIQEQLKGDWFDLQDLEGFLREKDVNLILCSDEPIQGSLTKTTVNIARLMPALISRGICLGRTPGFQRDDVEKALQHAKIS